MFLHINKWNESIEQERKNFVKILKSASRHYGFKALKIKNKSSIIPCDYVLINENAIYMISFLNIQGKSFDCCMKKDFEYYDLSGTSRKFTNENPYRKLSLGNDEFLDTVAKMFNRRINVGLEVKYIVVHPRRFEDMTYNDNNKDKTKHIGLNSLDYELQHTSKMKNLSSEEVEIAFQTIKSMAKD